MANKLDNLKKGVKFGEGQSNVGAGRPKKVLTKYKEMGYSKSQVRDTYAALAGMTKDELELVIKDKSATALEVSIARAFSKAMAKGEYRFIKDIVEMFADKPISNTKTEVTGANGEALFKSLKDLHDKT